MKLNKPRYLSGLSVLFWGYQCELLWFAVPMALILEARYLLNRRWALLTSDFYRVADLTSIGLVAMVLFLFLNRAEYHFITTLISWMPILLFPLVTVLAYSTTPRMSLDILFYSLRRQREPVTQSWDMDYVFLGACLLAAGLNQESGTYYFPVVTGIIIAALYPLKSPRFGNSVFILMICAIFLSATATHYGIRGAHLALKAKTEQWISNWISQRTDPMKTRTALGQVGRLKLSDAISFRIAPTSGKPDFPALLREAAYNSPDDTDWQVFDPRFNGVEHADDFRWEFTEDTAYLYPEARIYLEFDRERALIPVPGMLAEINELAATDINLSPYGTIQAVGLIPAPFYKIRYDDQIRLGDAPEATDLLVPEEYAALLANLVPETFVPAVDSSGDSSARAAVDFVRQFFKDFRYTLYQEELSPSQDPIGNFLLSRKAGHCEFFASSTALLLRQMGVPTRYVVGYAVSEWNTDMNMYIVRQRHAHAWVTAWVDGQWQVVDTTPSQWLDMEERQSGVLQPIWDFFGNGQFRLQLWWNKQAIEDYETHLYVIGFLLALILVWRISTSEQVIIENTNETAMPPASLPGEDSPFFQIEDYLAAAGYRRGGSELMTRWLVRIGHPELLPLLTVHNRWRFDPRGLNQAERTHLGDEVSQWLAANSEALATDTETETS